MEEKKKFMKLNGQGQLGRPSRRPTDGIFGMPGDKKDANDQMGTMMRATANNGLNVMKVTDVNVGHGHESRPTVFKRGTNR